MKLSNLLILMLLMSFGSACAVICAPALPLIQQDFGISAATAETCINYYLIGYAVGQLLYGPLINYFGSRKAILIGIMLEITGSILCVMAAELHIFHLLLIGRVIMALGAGSGLTLGFAISSKLCTPSEYPRVISLLTIAFAVTPGISVFVGGLLTSFGWIMTFYFAILYGVIVFIVTSGLPEVITERNLSALHPGQIIRGYAAQIKNGMVIGGGMLVGCATTIIYGFAAMAPFVATKFMHLSPQVYGAYNFMPVVGLILGSLIANRVGKHHKPSYVVMLGIIIASLSCMVLVVALEFFPAIAASLFLPTGLIYIGLSLVFSNGSALALSSSSDKGNASSVVSFINMGSSVVIISLLEYLNIQSILLLPIAFIGLCISMVILFKILQAKLVRN